MKLKNLINWKLYFLLLAASILSVVAIMPYIMSVQGDVLRQAPLPLPATIILAISQSVLLIAILLFFGLMLSKKIGLQLPIIENYINHQPITVDVKSIIKLSALLGILSGLAIILLDSLFIKLGVSLGQEMSIPVWRGFLAAFYGGITEEIIMRLFFMAFIAWLIAKISRLKNDLNKNNWLMWSAIIISSIIFGLGHLPITSSLTVITPLVITRAIVLNGIGGMVFGWLYWKKGLASAMVAHFCADIILHAIFFPLIASLH